MPISTVDRSWQLLTDEELGRWRAFYARRLALVDAEVRDPFEREPTRRFLAMLVGFTGLYVWLQALRVRVSRLERAAQAA